MGDFGKDFSPEGKNLSGCAKTWRPEGTLPLSAFSNQYDVTDKIMLFLYLDTLRIRVSISFAQRAAIAKSSITV